mgnify:CR=1 FL=1
MIEKVYMWLAWALPKELATWAFVRVATYGTVGNYSDQILPELTITVALERWSRQDNDMRRRARSLDSKEF